MRGGRRQSIQARVAAKFARYHPSRAATPPTAPASPAIDPSALVLGMNDRGKVASIGVRPRLEHAHVIGTTGGGKTHFLAHCIRQDIIAGRGVCVVDPHGNHPDSLYRALLAWLDKQGYRTSRVVHLIDPNAPTPHGGLQSGMAAAWLSPLGHRRHHARSVARVRGDEDLKTKPTISRLLTATFMALAEQGLTLAEAKLLFDPHDAHGVRQLVLGKLSDGHARDVLQSLHQLSLDEAKNKRDFRAEAVGPMNRLAEFVSSDAVRAIIGQTDNTLDLRTALDEGHIILANLAGGPQVYDGHCELLGGHCELLGRLLVRYLFFWAKARRHPERPFFVYLDECQRYLSGDVPNLLAELRKYGVGAILSHQWQAQLGTEDDNLLAAVRSATNLKAVFRVKDAKEAAELAELVVTLNLEEPVATLIKPTVVGHQRTVLRSRGHSVHEAHSTATAESFSESESESLSDSSSYLASSSIALGQGTASMSGSGSANSSSAGAMYSGDTTGFFNPADAITEGRGDVASINQAVASSRSLLEASAEGSARSSSSTVSRGTTHSTSEVEGAMHGRSEHEGESEAFEPIYTNLPTAVPSKENQLYKAAQMLRQLPTGTGYMSFAGVRGVVEAKISVPPFTAPTLSNEAFESLRSAFLEQSLSAIGASAALKAVADREQRLKAEVLAMRQAKRTPDDPESFRVRTPKGAKGP